MKLHSPWLLVFVLLLVACNDEPPGTTETIVETSSTEGARPAATLQPSPTATLPEATPSPDVTLPSSTIAPTGTTASPSARPPAPVTPQLQPRFQGLYFFDQATGTARTTFPAGTEQIFASWQYENMGPNDMVQRTWFKDNELWLERTEQWNSATYGAAGTMSTVSVYDFEDGLDPGDYVLQLWVNGQIQQEAAFEILSPGETGAVTLALSSETRLAKVLDGRTLVVEDMDGGNRRELAVVNQEIVDLRWFSDGRHLLYVEVDRSEQVHDSSIGVKFAMWLVEVDTPALSQLSSFEENLHDPIIPFGGGYIALFKGTNYGDACFVDRQLQIMELDESFQRIALYGRADFAGAPISDAYWVYPKGKLTWIDNASQLRVPFEVTCADFGNPDDEGLQLRGEYVLYLDSLTAERVADLPLP
jgi:hypothetical protein